MKTPVVHYLLLLAATLQNVLKFGHARGLPNNRKPNIIFIIVDDLGWNDVSFHGSSQIPTPNIDTLAFDGLILNNYYVQPMCTPSRSSLMSGRYPIHTGMQHYAILNPSPWGLPLNLTILPQWLKKQGYATHIVGKWHLGFYKKEYTPTYRGFDSHFGFWGSHEDYYNRIAELGDYYGYDFRSNMSVTPEGYNEYSTNLFTKKAVDLIKKQDTSQPLFLYLAYQGVHAANPKDPLQVPSIYRQGFRHIKDEKRKTYAGMVAALDDGIGQIVRALFRKGILENTIIAFTTDNGGSPSNARFTNHASNWPLRGTKRMLWEGAIRATGFAWSPFFKHAKGRVSHQLMHISDWLPTLYEAAGGDVKELGELDGVSMWKHFLHNVSADRMEILHNFDPEGEYGAIRIGDYKLVTGTPPEEKNDWYGPSGREVQFDAYTPAYEFWTASSVLRQFYLRQCAKDGNLNCIADLRTWTTNLRRAEVLCEDQTRTSSVARSMPDCDTTKAPCLFNIATDPCERVNLAKDHPQIAQFLMSRLEWYRSSSVQTRYRPQDPKSNPELYNHVWTNWRNPPCGSKNAGDDESCLE